MLLRPLASFSPTASLPCPWMSIAQFWNYTPPPFLNWRAPLVGWWWWWWFIATSSHPPPHSAKDLLLPQSRGGVKTWQTLFMMVRRRWKKCIFHTRDDAFFFVILASSVWNPDNVLYTTRWATFRLATLLVQRNLDFARSRCIVKKSRFYCCKKTFVIIVSLLILLHFACSSRLHFLSFSPLSEWLPLFPTQGVPAVVSRIWARKHQKLNLAVVFFLLLLDLQHT